MRAPFGWPYNALQVEVPFAPGIRHLPGVSSAIRKLSVDGRGTTRPIFLAP